MFKRSRAFFSSTLLIVALGYLFASQVRVEAQEPVNRKSSAKTREVLRWLYEAPNRPDKRVISGQTLHVFNTGAFYIDGVRAYWNGSLNPDRYNRIQEIHDRFGYWVGIAGAEYTNWSDNFIMSKELNPILIEHSRKGGIVSLHFHPASPVDGKYYEPGVTADLLLNPGPVHDRWMKVLYDAAAGLRELRDNDVVVLWRPMHARNAEWWWGAPNMSRGDYSRIWAHMVDHFSNVWGLDNILYFQSWYFASPGVYPYDLNPSSTLYAGDSNVDIVGVDHTEDPRADYAAEYNNLLSLGKPFGISEGSDGDWSGSGNYDMRRVIAHIKQRWPRCAFFIQFDNDHVGADPDRIRWDIAGNLFGAELLADPWVVNAPIFPGTASDPNPPTKLLSPWREAD
jgi:mannan endo-1,4-beta-mannosidase